MYQLLKDAHRANATVGSTTHERIKHDIIFGPLAPGAKLKLSALKERYGASVSILRETLNSLASEGFVIAEEQRGFFVAPVSREDIEEIANLRVLLEGHALKLSIERGDADWEGHLVAAHHKLHLTETQMQAGDVSIRETWKRRDWEFHQALIQACDSKNLLALHRIIFDKYLRYQMLVLTFRGEEAAAEHKAILEAALSRDSATAQKILERHILAGLRHALMVF